MYRKILKLDTFFRFVKGVMNIIDLLGILPYFMSLVLSLVTQASGSGSPSEGEGFGQTEMRRIAQIFRIMRILRIFKLARHITGLQTLGMTLRNRWGNNAFHLQLVFFSCAAETQPRPI